MMSMSPGPPNPPNLPPVVLQVDCSWCGAEIVKGNTAPGAYISHGICADCEPRLNPDLGTCPACKAAGFTSTGLVGCICDCCLTATFQPHSEALVL